MKRATLEKNTNMANDIMYYIYVHIDRTLRMLCRW